jgi:hypothetical protein
LPAKLQQDTVLVHLKPTLDEAPPPWLQAVCDAFAAVSRRAVHWCWVYLCLVVFGSFVKGLVVRMLL